MSKIKNIQTCEILDSRGNPTLEVEVTLESGAKGRAAVPSGASTGAYEAHEMRDGDKARYHGKGVLKALDNVQNILAPALIGVNVEEQKVIDRTMLELDGTENKSKLGANSILGVSMACAHAGANYHGQALFQYLGHGEDYRLPVPLMNILNGGAHADNGLDVQEFMIVPAFGGSFKEALRAGSEIFQQLKKILSDKSLSTAVGDEGGFAPVLSGNKEALELISMATEKAGYKPGQDIFFALDVAATEFFKDGKYQWEGKGITSDELGSIYKSWADEFPLVSIEDGFSEDDWTGWSAFNKAYGDKLQTVGDDLFVTNPKRLKRGIDEKAANALLVKVNQIGSLTETAAAVSMAHEAGFKTVMSHRSGETEDVTIADLSVAMNCAQIKTGSLCRGERTAKYNQLLRIEKTLGSKASYWGADAFKK